MENLEELTKQVLEEYAETFKALAESDKQKTANEGGSVSDVISPLHPGFPPLT